MKSEILAEVIRGETVESIHRGHLIILDGGGGETLFQTGNPELITFFRSAAKALQLIPCITSGAAEHFNFGEREIALACASHSGEKMHTALAAEMLEKAGLSEQDLKCGSHLPFNDAVADEMIRREEKPTQIHNNCSGKHAAMVAFAKFINADIATYEHTANPIQQEILETISLFTETPIDEIKLAVDGCAAPNFAVSVKAMARSFARLVNPPESFDEKLKTACGKIVEAKMKFPELVGGTGTIRHASDASRTRKIYFKDRRGRRLAVRRFAVGKISERVGHCFKDRRRRRQTRPRRRLGRSLAATRNFRCGNAQRNFTDADHKPARRNGRQGADSLELKIKVKLTGLIG